MREGDGQRNDCEQSASWGSQTYPKKKISRKMKMIELKGPTRRVAGLDRVRGEVIVGREGWWGGV